MKFGKIKFWAHQAQTYDISGHDEYGGWKIFRAIPIFLDNRTNRAIDVHEQRIEHVKTKRRKSGPSGEDWS